MPNTIFQIVLPLYALFVVAGLIAQRRHLAKQIGRNPIVIRPFHNTDPPYRYMEGVLLLCALALIVDIALNAISPDTVTQWLSIPAVRQSTLSRWLGLGLMTGGLGLSGAAVRHMGNSWRIGIDREHSGSLAVRGLFRRMRHPIYSGMLLVVSGMVGVSGDLISIAVAGAAWVGIPVQARLEEEFLLSVHGDEYRIYRARTGRFWPTGGS